MPSPVGHLARVEELIRDIFAELGNFDFRDEGRFGDSGYDFALVSPETGREFRFQVKTRERITPQIADDLFRRLGDEPLPSRVVRIVYAPSISSRVAEIARHYDVSYIDNAGNCRIADQPAGLLICRVGLHDASSTRKQQAANAFSPKSSRIIRAMLHEPRRGWQVSELAKHPDVDVSVGLASKVKAWLLRENYAEVLDRLLYLKRPTELLTAWTRNYPGASGQRHFYMRGEASEIEERVGRWCEASRFFYALARFSAAWRLAPQVRYSVASIYVGKSELQPTSLESLREKCGATEVDSGANLILLTPFDQSVYVRSTKTPLETTSPLQTFLDLQPMAGRGSEAADAVFEKHLRNQLK